MTSSLRRFSWQRGVSGFALSEDFASHSVSGLMPGGFASRTPCTRRPALPVAGPPGPLRPSIAPSRKRRNINLLSIGCALRPRLRLRLTLGGRTCPRKPWIYGGRDSHPPCRYSYLHGHLCALDRGFLLGFTARTTLSYLSRLATEDRGFGCGLESRVSSARNHSTGELLRFL